MIAWRARNLRPAMTRSPASLRRSIFLVASLASCAARKTCIKGGLSRVLRLTAAIFHNPVPCYIAAPSADVRSASQLRPRSLQSPASGAS